MNPGDALLGAIEAWTRDGRGLDDAEFDARARALFAYQLERNPVYARFAASLGFSSTNLPRDWRRARVVGRFLWCFAVLAGFAGVLVYGP